MAMVCSRTYPVIVAIPGHRLVARGGVVAVHGCIRLHPMLANMHACTLLRNGLTASKALVG
jgi:hypothetical protein